MKILKVASIYNKNSPNKFLNDLRRKTNIGIEDFQHVTAIHIEHLLNERYHLRINIDSKDLIEKLKNESEINHDKRSYTVRFPLFSYLFMTPEQSGETFYIEHNKEISNKVLKIRKLKGQHILDILNKLVQMGIKELEYVSVNNTHAFVGFNDIKEAKIIMKKLLKDKYHVTHAKSILKVEKMGSRFKNHHKISNHMRKVEKTLKNSQKETLKPKDSKKINKKPIKHPSQVNLQQNNLPSLLSQPLQAQHVINAPIMNPNNVMYSRSPIMPNMIGHSLTIPRSINMFNNPFNAIQHMPLPNSMIHHDTIPNAILPNSFLYNNYNYSVYPNQFM